MSGCLQPVHEKTYILQPASCQASKYIDKKMATDDNYNVKKPKINDLAFHQV